MSGASAVARKMIDDAFFATLENISSIQIETAITSGLTSVPTIDMRKFQSCTRLLLDNSDQYLEKSVREMNPPYLLYWLYKLHTLTELIARSQDLCTPGIDQGLCVFWSMQDLGKIYCRLISSNYDINRHLIAHNVPKDLRMIVLQYDVIRCEEEFIHRLQITYRLLNKSLDNIVIFIE